MLMTMAEGKSTTWNMQALFNSLFSTCLITSCWPKKVVWVGPQSEPGHRRGEEWKINVINPPTWPAGVT